MKRLIKTIACLTVAVLVLAACGAGGSKTVITGGESQDKAQKIESGARYTGTYTEGDLWVSFTTSDREEAEYSVILDNLTPGSGKLYATLFDEEGNKIRPDARSFDYRYDTSAAEAADNGTTGTGTFRNLEPKTRYYVKLDSSNKCDFSLRIADRSNDTFDAAEGRKVLSVTDELTPGTNRDSAPLIPANARFRYKCEDGSFWIAFRTGENDEARYSVTLTNLRTGSNKVYAKLFDEFGNLVRPDARSFDYRYDTSAAEADSRGVPATGTFYSLRPDSVYLVRIDCEGKTEFSLRITDPELEPFDPARDRPEISDPERFEPALNRDSAPIIPANSRFQYKCEDGYYWVAFRTGEDDEARYALTLTNLRTDSKKIYANLFDEFGNLIYPDARSFDYRYSTSAAEADSRGVPATGTFYKLKPEKLYYVRIDCEGKSEFSLRITDPELEPFDSARGREEITAASGLPTTTDRDSAPMIHAGTQYTGKYEGGNQWVAFKTEEEEDVTYSVTLTNMKPGSKKLYVTLYDRYGNYVRPDRRSFDYRYNTSAAEATENGASATGTFNKLEPGQVYFLKMDSESKTEYSLTVTSSSDPGTIPGVISGEGDLEQTRYDNYTITPGTSQTYALNIPLETKVFGKYESGSAWVAFTTTDVEDAEYYVTLVNGSVNSDKLFATLYDEFGNKISPDKRSFDYRYNTSAAEPTNNGRAASGLFTQLKRDHKYYIKIDGGSKVNYSIKVSSPSQRRRAISTSSSIAEVKGALEEGAELVCGTNQNVATVLRTNTRYHGQYTEGWSWVSFTTKDVEGAQYSVTLENLSPNSEKLYATLHDEFGNKISPDTRSFNYRYNTSAAEANPDGAAATGTFKGLKPGTEYFIMIDGTKKCEYMLMIGAPEDEKEPNTIEQAEEPEETVFEVPFELNETQVRFIANKAVFVNEEEAKEVLAPRCRDHTPAS